MRQTMRKTPIAVLAATLSVSPLVHAAGDPKAQMCAGCHGADGNSPAAANPMLAGQHPVYAVAAMQAYRDGTRNHAMMKAMVASLSDQDLEDLAAFYAAKAPQAAGAAGDGDGAAGKALTHSCAGCHGADGNSHSGVNPKLAGLSAEYLVAAMRAYRDDSREHGLMKALVLPLNDQQLADIAAFYATQAPR